MGQTYPLPISAADVAPANPHIGKPRHSVPGDWQGGVQGDDIDQSSATTPNVDLNGKAVADYGPRNQGQKATALGTTIVEDIARPRGWIDPHQPITAKPAAPVVTSISPTTGAQASLPLTVTITGTGFTPWSTVFTGGMSVPEAKAVYLSPTQMKVPIWAAAPGTVSVAVMDHDVLSNTDKLFTVT